MRGSCCYCPDVLPKNRTVGRICLHSDSSRIWRMRVDVNSLSAPGTFSQVSRLVWYCTMITRTLTYHHCSSLPQSPWEHWTHNGGCQTPGDAPTKWRLLERKNTHVIYWQTIEANCYMYVRMYIVKCVVMTMGLSSFYNTKTTARDYYRLLQITRDY